MAKKKAAAAPKQRTTVTADSVPCVRVVIGGKQGASGSADSSGCKVVGESRGGATKFNLGREFKATSKSVSTPKKNKPCLGALKRKGCPVQLAFDKGQPFLRFCVTEKQPGIRIDVNTPQEAQTKAAEMCSARERDGKFPEVANKQLGRARRR